MLRADAFKATRGSSMALGLMNKKQLAEHLQYPAIWQESGLLSDELFNFQAPEYQKEYGARAPDGGTELGQWEACGVTRSIGHRTWS